MTDDPAERRHELSDSLAAKNRWLLEISRRTDSDGRITSAATGPEPLPEPEVDEIPTDLDAQIREAEQAGDVARSIALKRQKFLTN